MSLKTLLMPHISARLLSRQRLLRLRDLAEERRIAARAPHELHYFHQADDPYSALTSAALPALLARYDVVLRTHVVGPPPDSAAPERERLIAYSRTDAQRLARRCRIPYSNPGAQPSASAVQVANALLVQALREDRFVQAAPTVSQQLWQSATANGAALPAGGAPASEVVAHLAESEALRTRWGHYLGATFYYGGEWYWGLDRLHHLEQRLQELVVHKTGVQGLLFPPAADLAKPLQLARPATLDFFFSLRSPYSAIVARRVFELARLSGAQLRLRYVLPMVMRGLPVPAAKRGYISQDTAREAFVRGIPFGRINDPVGKPTERGLSLMPLAERLGQSEAYVLSFMQGVWAEGLDAGSNRGLRRITERAGLPWDQVQQALQDNGWRQTAEANRTDLFALGLWGVPSFSVDGVSAWGQDRLWVIEEQLRTHL